MDCLLTIDINTSTVKIHAFDMNGKVICCKKGSYPTFHPQPDYSEQDPEQIYITTLYILKNLLNEYIHPKKYKVKTICFSSSMHSVLPVDKNGNPLGNAIIWADNRGVKEASLLKTLPQSDSIFHTTGTPIHPMSPLMKISWIKNHDQERFALTYKFISLKEYIIKQLTGEYVIDHSIASSTGFFDIHKLKWHQDSLDFAGITADRLSEPVSVFNSQVFLKKEICSTLGLPNKTHIIIGASDGCLATLGAGIVSAGKATITIGSSGAVRVAGKDVLRDEKQRFFNYLLAEGHYVSGGPTNNGGVVFEWFARQFGNFSGDLDFEDVLNDLFKEAAQVKAGADGLLFLPYLLGERAPLWNANARGLYFGLNINHQQKHFVRATLEGILFEVYSIGKILETHRDFDSIYINGAYATLPLWTQILTDMFGKTIHINNHRDSVAMGTALLALTQLGVYQNLEEAAATVKSEETYQPRNENHETYMKYFKIFEKLSYKLTDEFEEIVTLQQQD
ncbi:gluconokinase [Arcicella aurantiaca]|uniref:Gluconokinase n=1 Tax=Arcicella aurantiaca TaxID=591202 RepID=A0A316E0Q2_9BACT|nr:gluconokinase [Arcicella aurantiaca]PWK22343.1 gluconokinase [Arcicella aurantiaca]